MLAVVSHENQYTFQGAAEQDDSVEQLRASNRSLWACKALGEQYQRIFGEAYAGPAAHLAAKISTALNWGVKKGYLLKHKLKPGVFYGPVRTAVARGVRCQP